MTIRGISNTAPYTGQNARNDIHNQLTALWNSVPLVPTGVSGTNTILGTCDPPIAGYVDGQSFFLTMVGANSSTTVNVNIDGKGNRPLVDPDNVALPVNTTAAGRNELVRYNATLSKFILMRATRLPWDMQVAASDETSAIAAATNKVRWRMPRLITGMSVRASLATAQTSGSIFTVDIHKNGVSILSSRSITRNIAHANPSGPR